MKSLKTFLASSLAGTVALVGGGLAAVSAQESTPAPLQVSPIVAVHSGTCTNFSADAAYDLGPMERIPVQSAFEEEVDGPAGSVDDGFNAYAAYEDGLFTDADPGYVYSDIDEDGIFEVGFDEDEDSVLDEPEVLGEDIDGNAVLSVNELWGSLPVQTVWKAEGGELGVDGTELVTEGQYAVVIHAGEENYDQILACGPIVDLVEEDLVVVPLQSYSDSGYFGTTMIQVDEGEFATYLFSDISSAGQSDQASATDRGMDISMIMGDDNVFTEADDGYLSDDLDGDDVAEIGFDEDGDDVLDDNEVLGEDANDDGELTEDELDAE